MTDPVFYTSGYVDGDDSRRRVPTSPCGCRRRTYHGVGGHPFFERLNRILDAAGFDAFVEGLCAPFYARMGRPGLAPGRYFRQQRRAAQRGLASREARHMREAHPARP